MALSHLQFMDDTILFCLSKEGVLVNFKRILDCFEILLGLKIHYEKLAIIPPNCGEEWVVDVKKRMGCIFAKLPIKYLVIHLGENPQHLSTWKPVIDRIQKKLSGWKASLIS